MPKTLDQDRATWDWEIGTGLVTDYDDDGFLNIQVDGDGEDAGGGGWELHHQFGFASRPRDADADGYGCTTLSVQVGDEGHVWVTVDPRYEELLPIIKKGGSVQYGATGTFGSIDGEDGTWTKYVPLEFVAGVATKAHLIQCGLDANGKRIITICHADGYLITMHQDDGIQMRTSDQNTFFSMKPGEITMQATKIMLKGNVYLGAQAQAGLPLLAGSASPNSPSVFVSPA